MTFRRAIGALIGPGAMVAAASASAPLPQVAPTASGGAVPTVTVALPPGPPIQRLPRGTRIRIGFAPPLERSLVYIWSDSGTVQGHVGRVEGQVILRFTRSGDFYLLETRMEMPHMPPRISESVAARLLLRSIRFRIDREGNFIGIEDEEGYWRRTDQLLDRLAKGPAADKADIARMREVLSSVRKLPEAGRVAYLSDKVAPVTSMAGLDLAVGETAHSPVVETQLPLTAVRDKVKRRFDATLSEATADTAVVEADAHFDDADMQALVANLARQVSPAPPAPARLRINQTIRQQVFRDTGLTRRYTERIAIEGDSGAPAALRVIQLHFYKVE